MAQDHMTVSGVARPQGFKSQGIAGQVKLQGVDDHPLPSNYDPEHYDLKRINLLEE
jgi:hypothetical protein